jgi:hypothetical protein
MDADEGTKFLADPENNQDSDISSHNVANIGSNNYGPDKSTHACSFPVAYI